MTRKIFAIILGSSLVASIFASSVMNVSAATAQDVVSSINNLTINSSVEDLMAVRTDYDALDDAQKSTVSNYPNLVMLENYSETGILFDNFEANGTSTTDYGVVSYTAANNWVHNTDVRPNYTAGNQETAMKIFEITDNDKIVAARTTHSNYQLNSQYGKIINGTNAFSPTAYDFKSGTQRSNPSVTGRYISGGNHSDVGIVSMYLPKYWPENKKLSKVSMDFYSKSEASFVYWYQDENNYRFLTIKCGGNYVAGGQSWQITNHVRQSDSDANVYYGSQVYDVPNFSANQTPNGNDSPCEITITITYESDSIGVVLEGKGRQNFGDNRELVEYAKSDILTIPSAEDFKVGKTSFNASTGIYNVSNFSTEKIDVADVDLTVGKCALSAQMSAGALAMVVDPGTSSYTAGDFVYWNTFNYYDNISISFTDKESDAKVLAVNGASIKKSDSKGQDIRFQATFGTLAEGKTVSEYGMLLTLNDYINSNKITVEEMTVDSTSRYLRKASSTNVNEVSSGDIFYANVGGVSESMYGYRYVVRVYVKYSDGTVDYSDTCSRSVVGIAKSISGWTYSNYDRIVALADTDELKYSELSDNIKNLGTAVDDNGALILTDDEKAANGKNLLAYLSDNNAVISGAITALNS